MTLGHLAILWEALCIYDEVVIGIGVNPDKKTLFSAKERKELAEASILDFIKKYNFRALNGYVFSAAEEKAALKLIENSDCVKVVCFDDLTIDAALRCGATSLIRGERIVGDHDSEMALSMINKELLAIRHQHLDMSSIPVPDLRLTYISSSTVKNLCAQGEYIAAMKYVMPSVHLALMKRYLPLRFYELIDSKATMTWKGLEEAYSEKRVYHTLTHIGYCLNYADIYDKTQDPWKTVFSKEIKTQLDAAIFYHDFCNSSQNDDQKLSAEMVAITIGRGWQSPIKSQIVEMLIKATAHRKKLKDPQLICQVIHDVDLAILGDRENYGAYAMQVRQEFAEYSDKEYAKGRIKVLERFLAADKLYETIFFRANFENAAQQNMSNEIAFWQSGI